MDSSSLTKPPSANSPRKVGLSGGTYLLSGRHAALMRSEGHQAFWQINAFNGKAKVYFLINAIEVAKKAGMDPATLKASF